MNPIDPTGTPRSFYSYALTEISTPNGTCAHKANRHFEMEVPANTRSIFPLGTDLFLKPGTAVAGVDIWVDGPHKHLRVSVGQPSWPCIYIAFVTGARSIFVPKSTLDALAAAMPGVLPWVVVDAGATHPLHKSFIHITHTLCGVAEACAPSPQLRPRPFRMHVHSAVPAMACNRPCVIFGLEVTVWGEPLKDLVIQGSSTLDAAPVLAAEAAVVDHGAACRRYVLFADGCRVVDKFPTDSVTDSDPGPVLWSRPDRVLVVHTEDSGTTVHVQAWVRFLAKDGGARGHLPGTTVMVAVTYSDGTTQEDTVYLRPEVCRR